jgi:hypothetical protein
MCHAKATLKDLSCSLLVSEPPDLEEAHHRPLNRLLALGVAEVVCQGSV